MQKYSMYVSIYIPLLSLKILIYILNTSSNDLANQQIDSSHVDWKRRIAHAGLNSHTTKSHSHPIV